MNATLPTLTRYAAAGGPLYDADVEVAEVDETYATPAQAAAEWARRASLPAGFPYWGTDQELSEWADGVATVTFAREDGRWVAVSVA